MPQGAYDVDPSPTARGDPGRYECHASQRDHYADHRGRLTPDTNGQRHRIHPTRWRPGDSAVIDEESEPQCNDDAEHGTGKAQQHALDHEHLADARTPNSDRA